MATLHLVSHTHWDREWYLTFQQFRLRLVHLIDDLLEIFASDPDYRTFMLDGQTIVLDDYLAVRPEREEVLRLLVQSGRLLIGPWHVLPDEFLVSPESIIRNLLQGERTARRFGAKMQVGYLPDPFGHIGQMPQILLGFSIPFAAVQRGLGDLPCELFWQAPDGSTVLLANLRDGYGNAASLPISDPPTFLEQVRTLRDSLLPHSAVPDLLLMHGTDHMQPQSATHAALAYANQHQSEDTLIHSRLPDYFASLQSQIQNQKRKIPTIFGELRSSQRHPLLPGVISTRGWIKQRNHQCETLLEKWAEPFSVFAAILEKQAERNRMQSKPAAPFASARPAQGDLLRNPAPLLRHAWRLLMECHPHDSICGCSIDQVHDEMRPRFDQAEQIAEEITRQSLELIAAQIHTALISPASTPRTAVVVFNPHTMPATGITKVALPVSASIRAYEIQDEADQTLPCQVESTHLRRVARLELDRQGLFTLLSGVTDGKVTGLPTPGLAVQDVRLDRKAEVMHIHVALSDRGEPDPNFLSRLAPEMEAALADPTLDCFIVEANVVSSDVRFLAASVPALGYKTFYVHPAHPVSEQPPLHSPSSDSQSKIQNLKSKIFKISNEFFILEASPADGTITLTDQLDGAVYPGLNRFDDGGDCGDTYNYCPPASDQVIHTEVQHIQVTSTPLEKSIRVELELAIPIELAPDRQGRSLKTLPLRVTTTASLFSSIPRLEIHTKVDNSCKDHRLRVHFPLPFAVAHADHDGHFEVVRRPLGTSPHDHSWAEAPRPEVPQRLFTAIDDGQHGMLLANRGLREVEVFINSKGQAEVALTLLRCVGWLSRDDFQARKGHAGPQIAVPGAQMLGQWSFDYALIPYLQDEVVSAYHQAYAFNAPLRAVPASLHEGSLPPARSLFEVSPPAFILSAIKESENGTSWILRGYNLLDHPIQVTIKTQFAFRQVQRVNLAEEVLLDLSEQATKILQYTAQGHEIVTIKFSV